MRVAAISSTTDVFRRAVDIGVEIVPADNIMFYVINEAVRQPVEVASAKDDTKQPPLDDPGTDEAAVQTPDSLHDSDSVPCPTHLLMDVATDGLPLLISENNNANGLPEAILSAMVVPLKIRGKVFGVLFNFAWGGGGAPAPGAAAIVTTTPVQQARLARRLIAAEGRVSPHGVDD